MGAKRYLKEAERCLEAAEKSILLVTTKGSDSLPARTLELKALKKSLKKRFRTAEGFGLVIGDHRLHMVYETSGALAWIELAKQYRYLAEESRRGE